MPMLDWTNIWGWEKRDPSPEPAAATSSEGSMEEAWSLHVVILQTEDCGLSECLPYLIHFDSITGRSYILSARPPEAFAWPWRLGERSEWDRLLGGASYRAS